MPLPTAHAPLLTIPSCQDPRAEEALELTYTELDHWVSTQKRDATTTQRYSTPQAHGCVYAELAKR